MNPFARRRGFTLVELLVVIGIIAVLMGILMPSLSRAREQSNRIKCESNLRQIGIELLRYANDNNGWLYPVGPWNGTNYEIFGSNPDHTKIWTSFVFGIWNPPIMLCPSDQDPAYEHSYVLNDHLADSPEQLMKIFSSPDGRSPADVILMGEKVTTEPDYYMNITVSGSDFYRVVELYRHGLSLGSNYLFVDMHVSPQAPSEVLTGIDPWDTKPVPPGGVYR